MIQRTRPREDKGSDPIKHLALAVILEAICEARRKSEGALTWLLSDAPFWLDACGVSFDLDAWESWVKAGCPKQSFARKRPRNAPTSPQEALQGVDTGV